MAIKPNVLKPVKKTAPKGKQAHGKKKNPQKGLVRHGLFLFKSDCNLQESIESNMVDGLEHEKQMLQLMYMYQTYHNIAQMRQYASRGSKLVCQYGTKPALLDTLVDHGVYAGTRPVMTCADCREENLHDFGSCMCPERFYEDRLPMTVAIHQNGKLADRAPYNKYPHICVPLVNTQAGWYQVETGVFVEESNEVAFQALLDGAFLVCQYGGMITIPEVPIQRSKEEKKICVWCSKAVAETESAYMENVEEFTDFEEGYEFKQTNIELKKCFDGCTSQKCAEEDCTVITNQRDMGDIEDGIWQEYDDVYRENEKDMVSSENTYMICTKGGGFIHFLNAKQELLDIAEQFKGIDIYVTSNQLRLLGWNKLTMDTVVDLNRVLNKYEINTVERIRHFLTQCLHESQRGLWVREGEYKNWSSQEEYEAAYNSPDRYKYRGVGYIQMSFIYHYLSFAILMLKERYPELEIEWNTPAHVGRDTLWKLYDSAIQVAENAGYDVKEYKKIIEEGADYVAQRYNAWEPSGYFWKAVEANKIVDGLGSENVDGVDKITDKVKEPADDKSREERKKRYVETIAVIK